MYRIIGADGQQYGPVAAEQLRQWIAEGRANAQTLALADGSTDWKPLGSFSEFSSPFAATGAPKPVPAPPPIVPPSVAPFRKTNACALTGLVLGIISLTLCLCCYGFPFNVAGLIFSIIGLIQIKENPHLYDGQGLAITGLVLSSLSILWAIAMVAFGVAAAGWHGMPHRMYRL